MTTEIGLLTLICVALYLTRSPCPHSYSATPRMASRVYHVAIVKDGDIHDMNFKGPSEQFTAAVDASRSR